MTTPLIPTKAVLANTLYTPTELIADQYLEEYLLALPGGGGNLFIRAIMEAYRSGATSVVYTFDTYEHANTIATLIGASTDYAYTVTGPVLTPTPTTAITVSWA